jgi:uncharacterized protein (DUF1697 family)
MPVFIAMLRGLNLARHNRIKMDALRSLCETIGLKDCETHIQSGNVVFRTGRLGIARLSNDIASAIHEKFGFRPAVILRTPAELKSMVENAPFNSRLGFDPAKLLVYFLQSKISDEALWKLKAIDANPEQLEVGDRELFIYYPNGMARPKLSLAAIERLLSALGMVQKGVHGGKLIGQVAKVVGGGGGGKPSMAQAGGKEPAKLPEALELAKQLATAALGA